MVESNDDFLKDWVNWLWVLITFAVIIYNVYRENKNDFKFNSYSLYVVGYDFIVYSLACCGASFLIYLIVIMITSGICSPVDRTFTTTYDKERFYLLFQ